jgi:hypothetical protein
VNAATGGNASATDPATWDTLAAALAAAERHGLAGVGYVLGAEPEGPASFGIDLDGCRDPRTGEVAAWALAVLARFPRCFIEPSPSGTGLHLIGTTRQTPLAGTGNKKGPVECYWGGRFFTVTGRPLPGYDDPDADATEALLRWHAEAFPPAAKAWIGPVPDLDLDDEQILANARRMPRFADHWAGGGTGDRSAGDLVLLNQLIAAGATDPAQLDRLVRASDRMRPKWDQRRGQQTYGERSIARALDGRVMPFEGFLPKPTASPQRESFGTGQGSDAPEIGSDLGNPQDAATGASTDGPPLPDDPAALKQIIRTLTRALDDQRAKTADLERRLVMLGELQSRSAAINRNRDLGPARTTANAVVNFLASKAAAGAVGPDGMVEARLAGKRGLAEAAGVSTDTASKHLERLAEVVPLRKETRWVPEQVDPVTGTIRPGHKLTYLGLRDGATIVDLAAALAQAKPATPRNWGGKRAACPDCGDAGTVRRFTVHCAGCDRLLDRGEERHAPADASEPPVDMGNPQDAATVAATAAEPRGGVAPVLLSASRTASHNDDPTDRDGRIARARADLLARRAAPPDGGRGWAPRPRPRPCRGPRRCRGWRRRGRNAGRGRRGVRGNARTLAGPSPPGWT